MDNISTYFTYKEALWLPQWDRLANESDGLNDNIKDCLITLFSKMDKIRDHFNAPIHVHCAFRPEEYNKLVKGAENSAHKYGMACDFDIEGWNCDKAREDILNNNLLDNLNMRMENKPGSGWVHLDCREVPAGGHRFFIP